MNRHVRSKTHDGAVYIRPQCRYSGSKRRAEPFGKIRIVNELHRQPQERPFDFRPLMAGNDNHRLGTRRQHMFSRQADEGLAADFSQ